MRRQFLSLHSIPFTLLLSLFFGLGLVASRFGVGQFDPIVFVALRLSLAGIGYAAIYIIDNRRPWPLDLALWKYSCGLGLLWTAIPQIGVVSSLQYQSAGITSLLITTTPAMTVTMSHFLLHDERLTIRKGLGVVLAMAGVFLLLLRRESGLQEVARANPTGYFLVLVAMLINSGMTIFVRKRLSHFDALDVTSVRIWVAAGIVLLLSVIWNRWTYSRVMISGIFALGFSSIFGVFGGYLLAFHIIKRFGATPWATTFYFIPVISVIGGALFLHEQITGGMTVGMILIGTGIILIQSQKRHRNFPNGL